MPSKYDVLAIATAATLRGDTKAYAKAITLSLQVAAVVEAAIAVLTTARATGGIDLDPLEDAVDNLLELETEDESDG